MKSQDIDLLFGKIGPKQMNIPKLRLLAIFAMLLFTLTTLFYPLRYSSVLKFSEYSKRPSSSAIFDHHLNESSLEARLPSISVKKCDIFSGEWVPNPEAPYYTNITCREIHEHQNCMKFGRPDTDFIKWRWKPNDCELPIFNPFQFLEIVRGKSMAFVGDSVCRNQMQSMICLLSRVEWPIDASHSDDYNFKTWKYPSYNFTMATFWSPYLVRAQETDPNGPKHSDYFFNLYLDEFDEKWTTQIQDFDYVILNGGHWFFRPTYFYEKQKIVGCLYCHLENLTISDRFYGYRNAFRTAFRAINSLENFKGVTFLRTFAPAHFEGGSWKEGGDCNRTRPFRSNETKLEGDDLELYRIQLKEFKIAKREGRKKGLKFRLFDTTQAMSLRPDGHPSKYGHSPDVPWGNDCVHWCLPGPIDTWSDFLLEMLKMESLEICN